MSVKLTPAKRPYSERDYGVSENVPALSTAIDEIYHLRAFAALVAASIREDLELASLPKSARVRAERLLELTGKATTGEVLWGSFDVKKTLRDAGLPDVYGDEQWAAHQGVRTIRHERI